MMMNIKKLSLTLSGTLCLALTAGINTTAIAQETAIMQCIQQYAQMGISPDAALSECNKQSLKDCIKQLTGQKKVIKASDTKKKGDFLVDLGDNEYDWWEGNGWRDKGCEPNTTGPYRRQTDDFRQEGGFWKFGKGRSFEWFRQGWCQKDHVVLDENYSVEEAKLRCEVGFVDE